MRRLLAVLLPALVCLCVLGTDSHTRGQEKQSKPNFSKEVESIFFDNAFDVLKPGSLPGDNVPAKATPTPSTPKTPTNNTPPPPPPSNLADVNWPDVITGPSIEDEIKSVATDLTGLVRAKGAFKSRGYKQARTDFSTLAVLFGIIAQYPEDKHVRWREESVAMRDMMSKAGFACKDGNDESHRLASDASATLTELVRGIKISLPEGGEKQVPWPNVADLYSIMIRMGEAQRKNLDQWTASEADFKENVEKVLKEAELLAALAKAIQHQEYMDYEYETYKGLAQTVQGQSMAIVTSVKQNQYGGVTAALGNIEKACSACHADFK